jgi:hypothetical protein
MQDILRSIWELPWYKVLVVAMADDVILAIKMWPLVVVAIAAGVYFILAKRRKRRNAKG